MKCPRCSQPIRSRTYEGVEVDQCPSCSGIWLDDQELAPILSTRELEFSPEAVASAIATQSLGIPESEKAAEKACPKCGESMLPMNFGGNSGVLLDRCVEHGLWLDRGELERIQMIHEHWEKMSHDPAFKDSAQSRLADVTPASAHGPISFVRRLLELLIFKD